MAQGPSDGGDNVKVIVRCRPLIKKEVRDSEEIIVKTDSAMGSIQVTCPDHHVTNRTNPGEHNIPKQFTFDSVYGIGSKQMDIFTESVRPMIDSVLMGYNSTIFAYGQTGSGKTFTMSGNADVPEERGVIPNTFQYIFDHIAQQSEVTDPEAKKEYLVHASFLEIYNEDIRDLLCEAKDRHKLPLKQHPDKGVFVDGLSHHVVRNEAECEAIMRKGNSARTTAATSMNDVSSRSHSIFQISVESHSSINGQDHYAVGLLNLVDLAGSESQKKTGATGQRLVEANKINLSLTTLGIVIGKLVKGSPHIPYRNSPLTRLLQDSLGGNAKTLMVANVSPAESNYNETYGTLRYANQAKAIKNKPKINEDPKDAMLREMRDQIEMLRKQLEAAKGTATTTQAAAHAIESALSPGQAPVSLPSAVTASMDEAMVHQIKAQQELQAQLEAKSSAAKAAAEQVAEMESQLISMQGQMLNGQALMDETRRKDMKLRQAKAALVDKKRREDLLKRELIKREEEKELYKEEFASMQDELKARKRKNRRLEAQVQSMEDEMTQMRADNDEEKESYLSEFMEIHRELKRRAVVIAHFIPPAELARILQHTNWDSDIQEWYIDHGNLTGAALMAHRPGAQGGGEHPVSQFSRLGLQMDPDNPRHKERNVIGLGLDMPDGREGEGGDDGYDDMDY
ncbi:kinesin-like protein [Kipferlia bialata]|uniref:Kinesin-like protein n=1 Tax=Kipferlia bialata TaxID=797122 RepID=A0A9K3CMD6_9EUKA|nr:kinesin-like protein [Kipferlia bialata]|eukprot:g471.t1